MNAPLPLQARSGVALGLVLATYRVPAVGDPSINGYWNYAAGAFDPVFDKTKHVKPFTRVGVDGSDPNFKLQLCSAPNAPFDGFRPSALIYSIGADGGLGDLECPPLDTKGAREQIGLDS